MVSLTESNVLDWLQGETMEYLDSIHAGKVIRKTLFSLITNVNRHFQDKIVVL